jgi:hypothetical protein
MIKSKLENNINITISLIVIGLTISGSWLKNLYEFSQCDFESPWDCEIIHGIGIPIVPVSIVTAWQDFRK